VAGGDTTGGVLNYSALWAESPDPEADAMEIRVPGIEEETAFFFDNSRAYP